MVIKNLVTFLIGNVHHQAIKQSPDINDNQVQYKNCIILLREVTFRFLLWLVCNKHIHTPLPPLLD